MDQELEQLFDRMGRLLEISRRLAQDNAHLRKQIEEAQRTQGELQARVDEARTRVETALSRLPLHAGEEG